MICTNMLVSAIATAVFAAAVSHPLATVEEPAGLPSVGAVQPNGNARSELAGDPLDNAREAGGTLYGYRV